MLYPEVAQIMVAGFSFGFFGSIIAGIIAHGFKLIKAFIMITK